MQLSLQADYACRTMMFLALRGDERSSIEEVASAYGISLNHLVKIVHRLGKLGLVETTRGRGGGIRIARAPDTITIGEIVRQMEPSLALVECLDPAAVTRCRIDGACGLKPTLARATAAFLAVLDETSLAQAVKERAALAARLGADVKVR